MILDPIRAAVQHPYDTTPPPVTLRRARRAVVTESIWPNGSLKARFDSECPECGEQIREGAAIAYSDAHRGFTHAGCPLPVRPAEVACSTCWLVHPKGECDR